MKFSCDNCQARYQIADEKVGGRTLRMKCRRCGHSILIRGSASQAPPAGSGDDPKSGPAPAAPPPDSPANASGRTEDSQVGRLPRGRNGRDDSGVGPLPVRPSNTPDSPTPPRPRPTSVRPVASDDEPPIWHVSIHDVPVGPITEDEVAIKIVAGALDARSLCWREGFDDWLELGEIPELAARIPERRSNRAAGAVPPPLPSRRGATPSEPPDPLEPSEPSEPAAIVSVFPADVASIAPSEFPDPPLSEPSSEPPEDSHLSHEQLTGLPGAIPKASALPQDLFESVGAPSALSPGQEVARLPPEAGVSIPPPGASIFPGAHRKGMTTGRWMALIALLLVGGLAALVFGRQWLGAPTETAATGPSASAAPGVFHADRLNFELPEDDSARAPASDDVNAGADVEVAAVEPPAEAAAPPSTMRRTRIQARARAGSQMSATTMGGGQPATMTAVAASAMTPAAPTPMRQLTAEERARLERFAASSEASPDAIRGANTAMEPEERQEQLRPLSEGDIRRVVSQNQPSLQRCYEAAARGRLDSPSARLDVDVVVGTTGNVTRATARGQGFGDLASCVERAVRRWRFPRSQGGQTRFPVVFSGS